MSGHSVPPGLQAQAAGTKSSKRFDLAGVVRVTFPDGSTILCELDAFEQEVMKGGGFPAERVTRLKLVRREFFKKHGWQSVIEDAEDG